MNIKQLSIIVLFVFLSINITASVPARHDDIPTLGQNDRPTSKPKPQTYVDPALLNSLKPSIEATITLAELQETLIKLQEDLNERIQLLERSDKKDIVALLQAKRRLIIEQLNKLQGVDGDVLTMYFLKSQKKPSKKPFWVFIGTVTTIALSCAALASYDADNSTITWPSRERFINNIQKLCLLIQMLYQKTFTSRPSTPTTPSAPSRAWGDFIQSIKDATGAAGQKIQSWYCNCRQ
jgi:hypothetical protein